MEGNKILGLAVAASAAALFIAGCASMGSGGTEAKVACNGGNACKGQGFVSLTPEECKKATTRS